MFAFALLPPVLLQSPLPMKNLLTMILSGVRGERLHPLTADRAKPAVPFGGKYRIIDFTLSNCINSGLRSIIVLIQYKSHSLDRHIRRGWNVFNPEVGEYIFSLPPQQRISQDWYKGTADAVYQNWFIVEDKQPEFVLILAGDHIYKMNYKEMHSFLHHVGLRLLEEAVHFLVVHLQDELQGNAQLPPADAGRRGGRRH